MPKPTALLSGVAAVVAAGALAVAGASLANADPQPSSTSTASASSDSRGPSGSVGDGRQDRQRSDETPLSGEALTKATAAALAKEPGATVVRAETDADGQGTYEVHLSRSDGTRVTVFLDSSFTVTSVAADMGPGGRGAPEGRGA